MKRISVLIIMLTVLSSVTDAYYTFGNPVRYRTRWSPYAFGLVAGSISYSPYAFSYKHSGLVPSYFRYSPYAFGYKHSGLIVDTYYDDYYDAYILDHRTGCLPDVVNLATNCGARRPCYAFSHNPSDPSDSMTKTHNERIRARAATVEKAKQNRRRINAVRVRDGNEIVCGYLRSKNIDFKTNRLLRIDNRTVSVDFLLEDKNIIIKYWNPEEILSLAQKPEYKRSFYEKYKERSSNFCEEYKKAGGKVYQIESASAKEILAKLMLCHELNDG